MRKFQSVRQSRAYIAVTAVILVFFFLKHLGRGTTISFGDFRVPLDFIELFVFPTVLIAMFFYPSAKYNQSELTIFTFPFGRKRISTQDIVSLSWVNTSFLNVRWQGAETCWSEPIRGNQNDLRTLESFLKERHPQLHVLTPAEITESENIAKLKMIGMWALLMIVMLGTAFGGIYFALKMANVHL